jgi:hypothetical protein
MIEFLTLLVALPALLIGVGLIVTVLQILGMIGRLLYRWKHVPLVQRNHTRAGLGAFLMVGAIGLMVYGSPVRDPFNGWGFAGLAGLGAIYFVAGVVGSQSPRLDFMSLFWWSVIGVGCAAVLLHGVRV